MKRGWLVISVAMALAAACAIGTWAQPAAKEPEVSIRKVEEQVVLYTLHRGSYEKSGIAIGKLFALAGEKGIQPAGLLTLAYLNNPQRVSEKHLLTEIRIPVAKEVLKHEGKLGEFTDVKVMPATEAAVAVKPEGQADPGPIYEALMSWIYKHGYMSVDSPSETFLTNVQSGDYAKMKAEIIMPVVKVGGGEDSGAGARR